MPELLTLREAAERTGKSKKSLELRAERGSLRVVKREREGALVRLVPVSELVRAGLLAQADEGNGAGAPAGSDASALIEQVEKLTQEISSLRLLTEKTMSTEQAAHARTREALAETRAEATAAKALADELRGVVATGGLAGWRARRQVRREEA